MIIIEKTEDVKNYLSLGNYPRLPIPRKCPKSNCKGKLIRIGYYKRWICTSEEEREIRIGRVKCKVCKTSHALLPSFLIPRRQEVTWVIGAFLKANLQDGKSLKDSMKEAKLVNASRQKIRSWIKGLEKNLSLLSHFLSRVYPLRKREGETQLKEILSVLLPEGKDPGEALSICSEKFHTLMEKAII